MCLSEAMSYHLTPFAIELDHLHSALGSRDAALLGKIRGVHAADLKRIDRLLKDAIDLDEDPLTAGDVLRHLIMQEPCREDAGFAYGYCLQLMCHQLGEKLDNSAWSAMHGDWFDAIAAALRDGGVSSSALSIRDLAFRGSPVPLPPIDDFPAIGYLTAAEIGTARSALAAADFSNAGEEEAASIQQVGDWLNACWESNRGLVCFYA